MVEMGLSQKWGGDLKGLRLVAFGSPHVWGLGIRVQEHTALKGQYAYLFGGPC